MLPCVDRNTMHCIPMVAMVTINDIMCYWFTLLGWWMVLAGDDQGYAPASLLEPLDSAVDEETFDDKGE